MPVSASDERRHPVEDPSEHWSDSLYFNAWDPASGTFLLTRMAVLANQRSANALFLAWLDGNPSYGYYRQLDHLPDGDWDDTIIEGMRYRMDAALKTWTLTLDDGDDTAELRWDGFSGVFDYADNPRPLPRAIAWGHYEQTGTVTGPLRLGGRDIAFDGVGQRDHSWGHRDWAGVREWHWITGFFGTERSFNLFHAVAADGTVTTNGFVHDKGRDFPIVSAARKTREEDDRSPRRYEILLSLTDGRTIDIIGRRQGTGVPLRPGTTVVHEVPMRLESDGLEGFGIYELLVNDPAAGDGTSPATTT